MKNIIFDLGAVLVEWDPIKIIKDYTSDIELQRILFENIFAHQDWADMDLGVLRESEVIWRVSFRTAIDENSIEDFMLFTKNSLAIIKETEALVQEAYDLNYRLFCLSNMSIDTYNHIKSRHEFFRFFEGRVISGFEKMKKPDSRIYQLISNRFDLDPTQTLFVDDMAENIRAAKEFGFNTIEFERSDRCYSEIRSMIRKQPQPLV